MQQIFVEREVDFDNPLLLFKILATEQQETSESRGRVLIPSAGAWDGQPLAGQTPIARDAAVIAIVKEVGWHRAGFALKLHKSHVHFRG